MKVRTFWHPPNGVKGRKADFDIFAGSSLQTLVLCLVVVWTGFTLAYRGLLTETITSVFRSVFTREHGSELGCQSGISNDAHFNNLERKKERTQITVSFKTANTTEYLREHVVGLSAVSDPVSVGCFGAKMVETFLVAKFKTKCFSGYLAMLSCG